MSPILLSEKKKGIKLDEKKLPTTSEFCTVDIADSPISRYHKKSDRVRRENIKRPLNRARASIIGGSIGD